MKDVILFGNTDLAELILYYNKIAKIKNIVAITVHKEYREKNWNIDIPIIDFKNIEKQYSPNDFNFIVCIGYKNMNFFREKITQEILKKGYNLTNFIHPEAKLYTDNIGIGNIFFPNSIIDPFCKVGNGNIFYPYSILSHHSCVGNYNFFAVRTCIAGHVTIMNNCFLGANSTVKNGVSISSKALIGAGAYVSCNLEEEQVMLPTRSQKLINKKSSDFIL